jgi:hypothetical protein
MLSLVFVLSIFPLVSYPKIFEILSPFILKTRMSVPSDSVIYSIVFMLKFSLTEY